MATSVRAGKAGTSGMKLRLASISWTRLSRTPSEGPPFVSVLKECFLSIFFLYIEQIALLEKSLAQAGEDERTR